MEQVRSVRARYVKREAREGDDGMGLKYPQKDRVRLGTRQMRIGFPLTRFLMKLHRRFFYFRALVTGRKRLQFPSLAFLKW